MHTCRIALSLSFVLLLGAAPAPAQDVARVEPDASRPYVRLGRLLLHPTIALTNLGVDSNVFNEPDGDGPRRDLTLTVTPQTELWMRMGRSWVRGTIREDMVWYQTFTSERSANHQADAGWMLPLNRLTFDAHTAYLRTHDRPGVEVDARSQRRELLYDASVELRARPKTFVGVRADSRTIDFDGAATFSQVRLREALNRTVTSEAVTVRQQLTPLTAVTLDVGRVQDRFALSPLRDSNSTAASLGVRFDRFALIKGRASVGYRDFQPVSSNLPAYRGTTANADLSYAAFGTIRLAVQVYRDVQYSFDVNQPYFLLTGLGGSVQRRVSRPFDLVARAGIQRLAYREPIDAAAAAAHRVDAIHTFGAGLGYHPGNEIRVGFDIDQQRRSSPLQARSYHGLRFGTSITYGF